MEYAENGDMFDKITQMKKSNKYFNEDEIWSIIYELLHGLYAIHQLNINHRDIKSANIFITKDNNIKLGDLNVSKVAHNGLLYTQTGTP